MWVQVDFYKPGGKWYAGGPVDIKGAKLWQRDVQCFGASDTKHYSTKMGGDEGMVTPLSKWCNPVAAAIAENQDILNDGFAYNSGFIVVVRNIESGTTIYPGIPGKEQIVNLAMEDDPDTPGNFCEHLFWPRDFPPPPDWDGKEPSPCASNTPTELFS
jgi:hypothetical protein